MNVIMKLKFAWKRQETFSPFPIVIFTTQDCLVKDLFHIEVLAA